MKLTYSVRPVIRLDKKKANGTCPIHFSVRVGAVTTRLTSGKYIVPQDWDHKNNMPKKKDKFHQLLATYLNKKTSGFETYMLTQESLGKPITLQIAMDFFRDKVKVNLFKFWSDQIELWELTKKPNTIKSYKSGLNIIKEFNPKLNFGDLNYDCIQKFDLFLRKQRGNSDGGCYTKHKVLKAVINQALNKGYMNENPYRYFKIKAAKGSRKFLSIEEVNQLIRYEIGQDELRFEKAKDLFLFSCFTGLRFSDVSELKWESIKSNPNRIELKIQKTERTMTIPLSQHAVSILDKYSKLVIKGDKKNVFPKMCNQIINRDLKMLMEMVGINKSISFHSARHTFASNHVEAGTFIVHLKDLLGHSSIVQTQIYAKSLSSDLYSTMEKLNGMYSNAI